MLPITHLHSELYSKNCSSCPWNSNLQSCRNIVSFLRPSSPKCVLWLQLALSPPKKLSRVVRAYYASEPSCPVTATSTPYCIRTLLPKTLLGECLERNLCREALSTLDLLHAVCLTCSKGKECLKITFLFLWERQRLFCDSLVVHPLMAKNMTWPVKNLTNSK